MKKANIEQLTDSYKYYMRLKPPITTKDIQVCHPVGDIIPRKLSKIATILVERM